jgi:hypothetical protein
MARRRAKSSGRMASKGFPNQSMFMWAAASASAARFSA